MSVITTLSAGDGAGGISVGDKLLFGAYAAALSPETFDVRKGNDPIETMSNNTIRAVLAIENLVEIVSVPIPLATIFLALPVMGKASNRDSP
jgi:hypothetical protein